MCQEQEEPTVVQPPSLSFSVILSPIQSDDVNAPHENEWYRNFNPAYEVVEQPLHTRKPIHIIVVGAGASGLNIAFKAARQLKNVTISIYEKNEDIGGTWLENRYPGCTCDIPSHVYQWSFARSSEWSSFYAGSEEIWKYMKKWAVETGLCEKVKFSHRVTKAAWREDNGTWLVEGVDKNGVHFEDEGAILASCHGVLNTWKYPTIPGLDKFQGKLMHSARWDNDYGLTGKTVAVVGGGSSALQIIPAIQPKVKKLVPFLRSPVWITAGFGAKYAAPGGVNFRYTQEQKDEFETDVKHLNQYCRDVEGELNKRFALMHLHSSDQKESRQWVAKSMRQQLKTHPELADHMVPQFALGCRRMTPGSDYLSSLCRENVQVVRNSVTRVTKEGVVDGNGTEHKVDVIVFATGFDNSKPPYEIIGRDNRKLAEEWSESPQGYLSIMAEGFPNMFYFIGPNGPASHGSLLPIIEWHTRWMSKVIAHIQRTSIKSLVPSLRGHTRSVHPHTSDTEEDSMVVVQQACSSWFKGGKQHGPVTAIWPGSRMRYFEILKEPRFEDFNIQYDGTNRFAYLGNGFTETELDPEGNAVWYFDILEKELQQGQHAFEELA